MNAAWQSIGPEQFLWEAWGDSYSVFCRTTGETHLLSVLPAEVLRELGETPRETSELAQVLADRCEVQCSGAWQCKIESILEDLCGLELVLESF